MRQKEGIYMTHFYIIRHGETVFNRKGRIQGWCDEYNGWASPSNTVK